MKIPPGMVSKEVAESLREAAALGVVVQQINGFMLAAIQRSRAVNFVLNYGCTVDGRPKPIPHVCCAFDLVQGDWYCDISAPVELIPDIVQQQLLNERNRIQDENERDVSSGSDKTERITTETATEENTEDISNESIDSS